MFNNRVFTTVRQWGIWCIPFRGAVAQLVEHHVRNVGVESSNLFRSTSAIDLPCYSGFACRRIH